MELPIRLSKDSREPIYHQIEMQLKALIAGGHLAAGTPLPSIRALSKDLEISAITIRRAYQDLETEGFIRTSHGKGTFVAEIKDILKQDVKDSAVYDGFDKAVETAVSYDYSFEDIMKVFNEVLDKRKGNK